MVCLADSSSIKPPVLLVTDDRATVIVLRTLLERMGFDVQVANSCSEAMASLHTGIQWVVLDAEVRNGGLLELVNCAQRQQLPPEFILVAGDAGLKRLRAEPIPRPLALLRKPLEFSKLLDTMGVAAADR